MASIITTFIIFASLTTFIVLINDILTPFVIALILSYIFHPLLKSRALNKFRKDIVSFFIVLLLMISIIFTMVTIIPFVIKKFILLLKQLPHYILVVKQKITPIIETVLNQFDPHLAQQLTISMSKQTENFALKLASSSTSLIDSGLLVVNFFSTLILVPIILFYFLMDWEKMTHSFIHLIPMQYHTTTKELLKRIDFTLSNYVKGQLLVTALQGIFYAIILSIYGLDNAIIIGLIAGFATMVPYIGAFLSAIFTILIAYLQNPELSTILTVGSIFIVGQFIESNILVPKIIGKKVGLNPVWMIFSMIVCGHLMGFVGIMLALPIAAISGVIIKFILEKYHNSTLYKSL